MESSSAAYIMENKGKDEVPRPQGEYLWLADTSLFFFFGNRTEYVKEYLNLHYSY